MRKLLLLVEGQTEETFVRDVLSPWLASKGINPIAIIVRTKLMAGSPSFKGDHTSYAKIVDGRFICPDSGGFGR